MEQPQQPLGHLAEFDIVPAEIDLLRLSSPVFVSYVLRGTLPADTLECNDIVIGCVQWKAPRLLGSFLRTMPFVLREIDLDFDRRFDRVEIDRPVLDVLIESLATGAASKLRSFRLGWCSVGALAFKRLCAALHDHPSIEALSFDACSLPKTGASALFGALNQRHRVLMVCDVLLHHEAIHVLARKLVQPIGLQRLALQRCGLNAPSALAIGKVLASRRCTLRELDLADNDLRSKGVGAILQAAQTNGRLVSLGLDRCGMRRTCLDGLLKLLRPSPKAALARISLVANDFEARDFRRIARRLRSNDTLTHLDLSVNRGSDKAGLAWADVLTHSKSLVHLGISSSKLGNRGVGELLKGLRKNTTLEHLDIGSNGLTAIEPKQIETLARLSSLSLAGNRWDKSMWPQLFKLIGEGAAIQHLDLRMCRIDGVDVALLASVLPGDAVQLRSLDLSSNVIGSQGIKNLAHTLTRNDSIASLAVHCTSYVVEHVLDDFEVALQTNRTLGRLDAALLDAAADVAAAARLRALLRRNRLLREPLFDMPVID